MTDDTCEGYTNYETSSIGLEINNDQGTQDRWLNAARNTEGVGDLADELKASYEEGEPEIDSCSIYATLLHAAMSKVNWYELAEDLIQSDREILTGSIKIGSTSSDSCLLEDIVEGIEDLLPEAMLEEFEMYDDSEDDEAARNGIFDEICDYLNDVAPKGVTFGAHPDDPACFGFWKDEVEEST